MRAQTSRGRLLQLLLAPVVAAEAVAVVEIGPADAAVAVRLTVDWRWTFDHPGRSGERSRYSERSAGERSRYSQRS